jgi:hypothetical protein
MTHIDQDSASSSYLVEHHRSSDWLETMANCAQMVNKIVARNTCRVCHIYVDKQVEFEQRLQETSEWYSQNNATAFHQQSQMIELYRQYLFDEDSVVDSVECRMQDDEEEKEQSSSAPGSMDARITIQVHVPEA